LEQMAGIETDIRGLPRLVCCDFRAGPAASLRVATSAAGA
jgi:hypothetical protein